MNPEESLIQTLKQKEKIVFGKTIGTDPNGNCTIQGSNGSVLARSEGDISAGECVALQADDGQWYAVSARQTGTVAKKPLYSRKNKVWKGSSGIVVLFMKENALYVGGDRADPEQIYELNVGASFLGSPKINKTAGGYIATFAVTDGAQQLLCTVADGNLTTAELSGEYPFNELETVSGGYSEGFNCTLLTASFSSYDRFNGSLTPIYTTVIGQTEVLDGILQEVNVVEIHTNVPGGSYEVINKTVSIEAPVKTGSTVEHNFLQLSSMTATFAFNGSYGNTTVAAGDTISFEAIIGSQSYYGQGVAELIDDSVQLRITLNSFGLSPFKVFYNIQTRVRSFAIRLRKQHPNLINQNGFIGGATAKQVTHYADNFPLPTINPSYSAFSFVADVLNGVDPVISMGSEVLSREITVGVPPLSYSYFLIVSSLSLYFNSEESIDLVAWSNYIGDNAPTEEGRDVVQIGFRSYLIAISLDRLSSLYATYNPETTEDEIYLNEQKVQFGDLYLPMTDPIFPDEDPKNGVHLFNFYSPNLDQNTIYAVTPFPEAASGDVDIVVAEIQSDSVTFSTWQLPYIGITDEFKDFIIDASTLGA